MTIRTDLLVTAMVAAAIAAGATVWLSGDGPMGLERSLRDAHAQTPAPLDDSRRNAIVEAADRVGPSVVSVSVVATQVVRERTPFDDWFFTPMFPGRERLRRVQGLGSGFIVSDDGYVVTNEHVVRGATRIVVTLLDGRQLEARLVGEDEVTDLAVLKIEAEDLPTAPLGRSDDLLIGEWAIAIGNPFGYLLADRNPSVTVGVISAIGRDVHPEGGLGQEQAWSNMIQTDAAINPGNSGGPLVNARGEVIGVNAFIFSGGTGGSIGLGFAIPIDRVKRVLGDVVEFGAIRRPWTGLHLSTPPNRDGQPSRGTRVARVDPGSPAERAGIQPGDLVVSTDGRPLQSAIEWEGRLLDLPSGEPVTLEIERDERTFEVELLPVDDPLHTASRISTPFGVELIVVTPTIASHLDLRSPSGLLIAEMEIDSELRRLQLGEGDVLLAIGDRRLDTADDVEVLIETFRSGQPFALYYEHDGSVRRFCYRMMC